MPRTTALDAQDPIRLLEAVLPRLRDIDNKRITIDPDRGRGRRNDPESAEVSRVLLQAADQLALAEAEVRAMYWRLKGQGDPRFDN